jgi:hypothetical protein
MKTTGIKHRALPRHLELKLGVRMKLKTNKVPYPHLINEVTLILGTRLVHTSQS